MAAKTLIQTRIQGALPSPAANSAAHDTWLRAKVQDAIDDPRPAIGNEEVKKHFAQRRAAALTGRRSAT